MKEISISLKNQRDKEFFFDKDEYGNIRLHGRDCNRGCNIDFNIDIYYESDNSNQTEYLIGQIEWFMLFHDFRIMDIITVLSRLKYNFNADEEVQKMNKLIGIITNKH